MFIAWGRKRQYIEGIEVPLHRVLVDTRRASAVVTGELSAVAPRIGELTRYSPKPYARQEAPLVTSVDVDRNTLIGNAGHRGSGFMTNTELEVCRWQV